MANDSDKKPTIEDTPQPPPSGGTQGDDSDSAVEADSAETKPGETSTIQNQSPSSQNPEQTATESQQAPPKTPDATDQAAPNVWQDLKDTLVGGDVAAKKQVFEKVIIQLNNPEDKEPDKEKTFDYRPYSKESEQGDLANSLYSDQLKKYAEYFLENRILVLDGMLEAAVSDFAYALLEHPSFAEKHRLVLSIEPSNEERMGSNSVQAIADDIWRQKEDANSKQKNILFVSCGASAELAFPQDSAGFNSLRDALQKKNRWIIIATWGCQYSDELDTPIEKYTRPIDSYPYLIRRCCPKLAVTADTVEVLESAIIQYGRDSFSDADKYDFARKLLSECRKATAETFTEMLNKASAKLAEIDQKAASIKPSPPVGVEDEIIHILAFLAVKLPGLGIAEYEKAVSTLVLETDAKYSIKPKSDEPDTNADTAGDSNNNKNNESKQKTPSEIWRERKLELLHLAGIGFVSNEQRDSGSTVSFISQESKRIWTEYFNDAVFETSALFSGVRRHRLLLTVNDSVVPAIANLYAVMASTDPHEFRTDCIPELVEICQTLKFGFVQVRVVQIIKALLKNPKATRSMAGNFFNLLLHHNKDFQTGLDLIIRLAFVTEFDNLTWLKIIITQAPSHANIQGTAQRHLEHVMQRHPDGPLPILVALLDWINEDDPSNPSAHFAISTIRLWALHAVDFYFREPDRPYPLLTAIGNLDDTKNGAAYLLKILYAVGNADLGETAPTSLSDLLILGTSSFEHKLARVIQSWFFIIDASCLQENSVYQKDEIRELILLSLKKTLDRHRRMKFSDHLMQGIDYATEVRSMLFSSTFSAGLVNVVISELNITKQQLYELFRIHITGIMGFRREVIRLRDN